MPEVSVEAVVHQNTLIYEEQQGNRFPPVCLLRFLLRLRLQHQQVTQDGSYESELVVILLLIQARRTKEIDSKEELLFYTKKVNSKQL